MNKLLENFNETLLSGGFVIGPFMKTCDPAFVEVAGYSGFHFAILDMEHGPVSIKNLENLICRAILSDLVPIVRVPDSSSVSIGKALDVGALGIQVPQIQNADQAKKVISRAKFSPTGERGLCRFVRSANYSAMDRYEYLRKANQTLVVLQLEGKEAIDNIDEILEVDGIDILFIGPYDLSQSIGVPGDITNPKVIEYMELIAHKANEKNMIVGTFIDQPQQIDFWKKCGVQYLSYSVDVGIFLDACKKVVAYFEADG